MYPKAAFAVSYFVSDNSTTPLEDTVHGDVNMGYRRPPKCIVNCAKNDNIGRTYKYVQPWKIFWWLLTSGFFDNDINTALYFDRLCEAYCINYCLNPSSHRCFTEKYTDLKLVVLDLAKNKEKWRWSPRISNIQSCVISSKPDHFKSSSLSSLMHCFMTSRVSRENHVLDESTCEPTAAFPCLNMCDYISTLLDVKKFSSTLIFKVKIINRWINHFYENPISLFYVYCMLEYVSKKSVNFNDFHGVVLTCHNFILREWLHS